MPLFQKNIVRKFASALNPEVVHEASTRFKASSPNKVTYH